MLINVTYKQEVTIKPNQRLHQVHSMFSEMKLQCLVASCVFVLVHSASVRQREIPVYVVYDETRSESAQVRQQLPQDELQIAEEMKLPEKCDPENVSLQSESETSKETINSLTAGKTDSTAAESRKKTGQIYLHAVRNLDEKTQLSPTEEKVSLKHLPDTEDISAQVSGLVQETQSVEKANVAKSAIPIVSSDNKNEDVSAEKPHSPVIYVLEQAEEIATIGIKLLRDRYVEAQKYVQDHTIEEGLNNLQKNVEELFETQRENITTIHLKQSNSSQSQYQNENQNPSNIIQNILGGFQNLTNNFMQGLQQQRPNGTQSEEQQGGFQGFFNYFSTGFQQIMNNINSLGNGSGGGNGTQSDTGSTDRPNLVSNFVSTLNQFFQNQIGQQQSGIQGNQSDTGSEPSNQNQQGPQGFIQGAINQFNQVVSNIIPQNRPTPAPGAQADTGTNSSNPNNPLQAFQNFGNQVISNFNQLNPFVSSTKPPGASGDEGASTTERPSIVQVIQGFNPFRPQQGQQPGDQPANPIVVGIQNAGNQIQQAFGNQSFPNPVESFQNAVGGGPNGSNPIQTIQNAFGGGQNGSSLLQSIQNVISDGQNGGNPIPTKQNDITGIISSGNKNESGSKANEESSGLMGAVETSTFADSPSTVKSDEATEKNIKPFIDIRTRSDETPLSDSQQVPETMEAVE